MSEDRSHFGFHPQPTSGWDGSLSATLSDIGLTIEVEQDKSISSYCTETHNCTAVLSVAEAGRLRDWLTAVLK